jgi:multiple sugar transport system permease protein
MDYRNSRNPFSPRRFQVTKTQPARRRMGIQRLEARWGVLLAMPAILGYLLFVIGPIIASFVIGLTDWKIGGTPAFVGLANYQHMVTEDELFGKSLFTTAYYTLGAVPLGLIVAFAVAMLLNHQVRGKSIFRTIFYLPVLVPAVANNILWLWLFNPEFGLLNSAARSLGLPESQWIYDETTVIPSLILMSAWGFGNAAVIFLAGLQGVPTHLYEAIEVDGGTRWHKFRYVTIPMMTPTIFFNLVLGLIGTFQVFNEAYVMTGGGPSDASLFYVFYIYRTAFTQSNMGYASALAWALFVIVLIVTLLVFRSARSWVYYEGEAHP